MKVISVNVGQPTAVQVGNRTAISGIRKHPVPGRVRVTEDGLEGDRVLDKKHHGGPDQAVYVYTREDYDAWNEKLGRPLSAGRFGENILLSGLESAGVQIGERFMVGQVVLEATAPRIPCGVLGAVMEDAGFVKRFAQMARPGFYARVVQGGELGAGDPVTRQPPAQTPVSVSVPTIGEMFALWYASAEARDPVRLRQILEFPVAERVRTDYAKWLGAS